MKRRSFLKAVGGAIGAGAVSVGAPDSGLRGDDQTTAGLPQRVLGRTGKKVSVVGFPGLALVHYDQEKCTEGLRDAFKRGVDYFDVAPAYGKGEAEIKMGVGLQGLDRSRYFLSCKTKMRDKEGAREELERSLKRLRTSYFDLYQLHCLKTPEEVEKALGPGGAIETLLEAKKEGKALHLGFSAHTTKAALAAMKGFRFDTVMFPINFVEFFHMGYGEPVLELATEQGAAVIAIKPLCRGAWPTGMERTRRWWYHPVDDKKEVDLALRFTLSQPNVVTGIPPSFLDIVDLAIDAATDDRPISESEMKEVEKLAKTCHSIFKREEDAVAMGASERIRMFPGSPHDCWPGDHA
jgi:predicted aldo/keto reductase-like oxidoreductase